MTTGNQTARGLQKLKSDYNAALPGKLAAVIEHWSKVDEQGWLEPTARQIHGMCHQLAGTGETFGHPGVTRHARSIVYKLNRIFDQHVPPGPDQLSDIDLAISLLTSEVTVTHEPEPTPEASTPEPPRINRVASTSTEPKSGLIRKVEPLSTLPIYIVEDDQTLADHIVMELALQGYDAHAVYDLADLDRQIRDSGTAPGALVMDVIFPEAVTGGIDIINQFRQDQILKAPVIFISAGDSFNTRLEIVRAGGDAFFVKPFDINHLIEKLEELVGETHPDPLRVLVLDDDEITTGVISLVLEQAGLSTRSINEPRNVIEATLDFHPDLIILDLYMPDANGMEVAQVLRQHESCSDIPILFLSSESDAKVRAEALNIGVDDFLIKPIEHEYLVSAVANRALRARSLGAKIYRDSLTQLLVHDEIKKQLSDQLNAAQRNSRSLCYVLIDLDNFKAVNDTQGHLTGDHVLKNLASLLRRSFRRSDVLGRYGGEEFVVVMPDTQLEDAVIVLDKVRHEFSKIEHRAESDGSMFHVTFSAGISSYPEFTSSIELLENADRALYEAKAAGRNQITYAQPGEKS